MATKGNATRLLISAPRLGPANRNEIVRLLLSRLLENLAEADMLAPVILALASEPITDPYLVVRIMQFFYAAIALTGVSYTNRQGALYAPCEDAKETLEQQVRPMYLALLGRIDRSPNLLWSVILTSHTEAPVYIWFDRGTDTLHATTMAKKAPKAEFQTITLTDPYPTAIWEYSSRGEWGGNSVDVELSTLLKSSHREVFYLLVRQLLSGEPAETTAQMLGPHYPALIQSLRDWCYTDTGGVRPLLSTLPSRERDWNRLLTTLDIECGITDPAIKTLPFPLPIER